MRAYVRVYVSHYERFSFGQSLAMLESNDATLAIGG